MNTESDFGNSALVGLAVMLVLLPVPAKGAKLMIGVEKKVRVEPFLNLRG